jgi:Flp pilus assembly protein TadG
VRNLIHTVARRMRADPGDRGAVAVLVAVLLGSGVLLGMGALVIDVGQLYQNRAELQNGADSAAFAVAKSCATGDCTPDVAAQYASANARSGIEGVSLVCGSGTLGTCPASTGALTDCPSAPTDVTYVDVHTSTLTASGSKLLPPAFAGALPGMSGYKGSTVLACAQAEWGPAQTSSSLGVTISVCSWDSVTTSGSQFGTTIGLPFNSDAATCRGTGSGCDASCSTDTPGGFGWLPSDSSCQTAIDLTTDESGSDPGDSVTSACDTSLQQDVAGHTVVFLPVFTCIKGSGSSATYTFSGLAAFVITGYKNISGISGNVIPSGGSCSCADTSSCLFGYFTQALDPATNLIGTGTDFGATTMKLTG